MRVVGDGRVRIAFSPVRRLHYFSTGPIGALISPNAYGDVHYAEPGRQVEICNSHTRQLIWVLVTRYIVRKSTLCSLVFL